MKDAKDFRDLLGPMPEQAAAANRWSRVIETVGAVCALVVLIGSMLFIFTESPATAARVTGVLGGLLAAVITWAGFHLTAMLIRVFSGLSQNPQEAMAYQPVREKPPREE